MPDELPCALRLYYDEIYLAIPAEVANNATLPVRCTKYLPTLFKKKEQAESLL